jgi:hypothetical protein
MSGELTWFSELYELQRYFHKSMTVGYGQERLQICPALASVR